MKNVNHFTVTDVQIDLNGNGICKATAHVVLNNQLVLTGLRILDGVNGLFVGYPKGHDNNGADDRTLYYPADTQLRDHIEECVIAKYKEAIVSRHVRTNWDLYCERYGTDADWDVQTVKSVELNCNTCPASGFCKKSKSLIKGRRGVNCSNIFIRWATSEAKDAK